MNRTYMVVIQRLDLRVLVSGGENAQKSVRPAAPAIQARVCWPFCFLEPATVSYSVHWQGGTMNKQELVKAFAIATVTLLSLLLSTSIALASVPKAKCGP